VDSPVTPWEILYFHATAKVYDLTLVTADDNLLKGKGYSVLMAQ